MSQTEAAENHSNLEQIDWSAELENWSFAGDRPPIYARVKTTPQDFIVRELMDVVPSGQGEHIWLDITKTRQNTDRVARELAKFSGVSNRDIGYSGLKDFHAVTRQWFSVWRPKGASIDWSKFRFDDVRIHQIVNHSRKIKRSTHRANHFEIRLRDLSGDAMHQSKLGDVELASFEARIAAISNHGVPNYFGAQRFGRNANNLSQALAMFSGAKRVRDKALRGLLLSSARSWLFNCVLSARVADNSWDKLFVPELANLHGSNSTFLSTSELSDLTRLQLLDIHPTAPMWGEGRQSFQSTCEELAVYEDMCLERFNRLQEGLESARLTHQRRATRCIPRGLSWQLEGHDLILKFELISGQFATSVLRELIQHS